MITFKDLTIFMVVMGIFYLIGSFNALSFDPTSWPSFGRYMFSVMGTLLATIITVAIKFKDSK